MQTAMDDTHGDQIRRGLEAALAAEHAKVERLTRGIDAIAIDLTNAEVSLRAERRKVTELRKALERQATGGTFEDEIECLFDYWRVACDHPRARLDTKRATVIKARLTHGHTVLEVMRAIDGARFDAFVGDKGKRFDELELVLRDEVKFDQNVQRWETAVHNGPLREPLRAYCLPAGQAAPEWDALDQAWRFKCPVCRTAWAHDDYFPFKVSENGLFCDAVCVQLTVADVREALASFPMVDDKPPAPDVSDAGG